MPADSRRSTSSPSWSSWAHITEAERFKAWVRLSTDMSVYLILSSLQRSGQTAASSIRRSLGLTQRGIALTEYSFVIVPRSRNPYAHENERHSAVVYGSVAPTLIYVDHLAGLETERLDLPRDVAQQHRSAST